MKTITKILGTSSLILGLALTAWPTVGQQKTGTATIGGRISGVTDMNISSVFVSPESGLSVSGISADRSHIVLNISSTSVGSTAGQSVITIQLRSNVAYTLEAKLASQGVTETPINLPINLAIKQISATGGLAAPDAAGNSHVNPQFTWGEATPTANFDLLKGTSVLANGPRISIGGDMNTAINALAVDVTLRPIAALPVGWTAVLELDVKPAL